MQLKSSSDTPRLDAKLLYRHLAQLSEVELIIHSNQLVEATVEHAYKVLIAKRKTGVPVAYLTGTKEFWSLPLKVTPDTLIPRPETELLVESALAIIDENHLTQVLDLGTGSGAIAIAIANSRPAISMVATDKSNAALTVARDNAQFHQLTNISFTRSSWYENIEHLQFDLIVSNPPYVRTNDPHLRNTDIRHEPVSALAAGEDGLCDLRIILAGASRFLNSGGWLLTEHGYDQQQQVTALFYENGFKNIKSINDLSQTPRITLGQSGRQ